MICESGNIHDNRLWAVLFLGLSMLLISGLRQMSHQNDSNTTQQMVLRQDGQELAWVPGKNTDTAGEPLSALLTPFFFAPVRINSADNELLTTLPGIGPGMAGRILDFRQEHGPIENEYDFMRIKGIGPKRFRALRQDISFE